MKNKEPKKDCNNCINAQFNGKHNIWYCECECHQEVKEEPREKCEEGCLKHKYHCAKCMREVTYSPQNFASRPQDIINHCEHCMNPQEGVEDWEERFTTFFNQVWGATDKELVRHWYVKHITELLQEQKSRYKHPDACIFSCGCVNDERRKLKQEILEKLPKEKVSEPIYDDYGNYIEKPIKEEYDGYNKAVEEIKFIIEKI